jgi:hypothetical protein
VASSVAAFTYGPRRAFLGETSPPSDPSIGAIELPPSEARRSAPAARELGERYDGETLIEGLPPSTLRNFTRKMTFVPSGHDFRGSQKPRALTRSILFYIDPRGPVCTEKLKLEISVIQRLS